MNPSSKKEQLIKLAVIITIAASATLAQATGTKPGPGPKKKSIIPKQHTEWKDWGGGPDHSKFVDFHQITKDNVNQLEIAFVYPSGDNGSYKFNPIVVDNVMYVLAKNNSLVALDATTGKEIWIHASLNGIGARGINFWQSKDKKQKRFIMTIGNTLQEIDANTGKLIMSFGTNGYVDLRQGLDRDPNVINRAASTSPGHIYDNLFLMGSAPGENLFAGPGHLRAFDIITGKQKWIFHTIPFPGEYGYNTWPKEAYKYVGAVNTWGEISVDEKRGIAYYPLGSPTYDYDGSDREGKGLFGNCILALDARTGKRLWHFQTVHHDLWDYDLTAAPQLITVMHKGKKVDAVAVAGKNGFLYVFNRVTGEPLWPIEERPVPKSEMATEHSWPTQPFPTVIPPFNRHNVTVNDINPYLSPEEKEKWTARVAAAKSGMYQPLSDKYETIALPGSTGGANLGATASNPDKGLVYVMYQELSNFYQLKYLGAMVRGAAQGPGQLVAVRGEVSYAQYCQGCHGADHAGMVGGGASLVDLGSRIDLPTFKTILDQGKGRMPAQPHLDEATVSAIYQFLAPSPRNGFGSRRGGGGDVKIDGPVVETGPVPVNQSRGGVMKDYPAGYTGPRVNFVEKNNWGTGLANMLTPPWSAIAAYDLNKGIMKWRIPLGDDPKLGKKGLGMPGGSSNKGMIVTPTGLLFAICGDGHVYGYDAETGKTIWDMPLGRTPSGMPAMYEANGRQYLVVCSTGGLTDKTKADADVPKGYVVFALPKKSDK
ncbi:MAG TPA: PQQ-binding-like beta-propeller repeat protein [Mucilaginibacter sp.]|nr:PQQ-binding-like beta-propeller repeat protein [Mucilaginibacter sp.]